MSNLTVKAVVRPVRFNALEYALLAYIATESNADGLFQQPASKITDTIEIGERAIQKTLRGLVSTGHLVEVDPRRRDEVSKFWVPASYRLARPANKVADLRTSSNQTCEPAAVSPANVQQVDPTVYKFADETKDLAGRPANFFAQNHISIDRTIEGSDRGIVDGIGIGVGHDPRVTSVPSIEPHVRGDKVPALLFHSDRLPFCRQCGIDPCDYFEDRKKELVTIEHFCSDNCHDDFMTTQFAQDNSLAVAAEGTN